MTNTLAYFAATSATNGKKFYKLDFRCQCYKTFSFVTDDGAQLARVFVHGNPFQSGLTIWGQDQSQPYWSTFQLLSFWASSWCYQQMLKKWLPGTNTLAYLASSLATKEKSFITLTSGWKFEWRRRSWIGERIEKKKRFFEQPNLQPNVGRGASDNSTKNFFIRQWS